MSEPPRVFLADALEHWAFWERKARDLESRVEIYHQRADAMAMEIERLRELLRSAGVL